MNYNNDNGNNKFFKGRVVQETIKKIPKVKWNHKKIPINSDGSKFIQVYECIMSGGEGNNQPPVYQLKISFGMKDITFYTNDPEEMDMTRELIFFGLREFFSENPVMPLKDALYKELNVWRSNQIKAVDNVRPISQPKKDSKAS